METVSPTEHLGALSAAFAHARSTGTWIVVVCANEAFARASATLVAARPEDARVAGNTVVLPGGGRVTVVRASHRVAGSGFAVMFLGFDSALQPADEIAMHTWRERATGMAVYGGSRNELRVL